MGYIQYYQVPIVCLWKRRGKGVGYCIGLCHIIVVIINDTPKSMRLHWHGYRCVENITYWDRYVIKHISIFGGLKLDIGMIEVVEQVK